MVAHEEKRHSISEVSEETQVPIHVLRQWEARFPQLKPKRTRSKRRYYTAEDIEIVRRIRQLLWVERMTTEGARQRLAEELRGEGRPRTQQEVIDRIDAIEAEIRALLDLLDNE